MTWGDPSKGSPTTHRSRTTGFGSFQACAGLSGFYWSFFLTQLSPCLSFLLQGGPDASMSPPPRPRPYGNVFFLSWPCRCRERPCRAVIYVCSSVGVKHSFHPEYNQRTHRRCDYEVGDGLFLPKGILLCLFVRLRKFRTSPEHICWDPYLPHLYT